MRSLWILGVLGVGMATGCSAPAEGSGVPLDSDGGTMKVKPVADAGSDARGDAGKSSDAAPADVYVMTPSCPTFPVDESGFSPSPPTPAVSHKGACGAGQLTSFYSSCMGASATNTSCNNWYTSYTTCWSCLVTKDYAPAWGPIIDRGNFTSLNRAGCVELLTQNPAPSGTCAYAVSADIDCTTRACETICYVDSNGNGLDQLQECVGNAANGTCKPYDDQVSTLCNLNDASAGGPYARCFGDGQQDFVNLASTFCGGS